MVTLEIADLKDERESEDLIFSGSEFQTHILLGKKDWRWASKLDWEIK